MTIPNGLYSGKTATATSSALLAENIKSGTTIFNVEGTYGGSVPRTGQTPTVPFLNPAPVGSDGNLQKGVTWPSPRFKDNLVNGTSNGTVTDNLTGLIWLKVANYNNVAGTTGETSWENALAFCNALHSGVCGLNDSSVVGDWRLPNIRELFSLIDLAYSIPALSNDAGTGKWVSGDVGSSFISVKQEGILQTGIICTFLMLPLPAGEGWGGGPKVQIVTVGSITTGRVPRSRPIWASRGMCTNTTAEWNSALRRSRAMCGPSVADNDYLVLR